MSNSELACVYAALILADDDVAVTTEKINTILKAAGVEVEPYWPGLFSKVKILLEIRFRSLLEERKFVFNLYPRLWDRC